MNLLSRKYLFLIMGLLILIGLELRLVFIDLPLWYDEAQSVLIAKMSFPFEINKYLLNIDMQHTPLYFYLLHFWIKIFGENDIALRILSLIFSLATIPCIYKLAKNFVSKKFALIAPLLMVFNTFNIIYSTEVRMYSIIIFLTVLSMNYLLEYLNTDSTKSLIKLTVTNLLMPYTLVGAFVFVIAQIISTLAVYAKSRNLKKYLISNLFLFILLIPYFITIIGFYLKRSEFLLSHVTDFSISNTFGIFQNFLAPDCGTIYWATLNPFYINLYTVIYIFLPLFFAVYLIYLAIKNSDDKTLFLSLITLVTFGAFVLFAINKTIVLAPRYLVFISPLLLILLVSGLSKIKKSFAVAFIAYYILFSTIFVYTNTNVKTLKTNSLMASVEFIKFQKLTNKDMVIMPFASSVIGHYLDNNSPQVPRIEALQDLRIYNNKNIYSEETIEEFRTKKVNDVFRKIILSDNYISDNFHNYILKTFINPVEKNHYIVLAVFSGDTEALIPEEELKDLFSDKNYTEKNILNGMLSKMYLDIHKTIQEKAKLIDTQIIGSNVYFIYKKN